MEKENTKTQLLEAALELFSVNGYEATSISQLADAVGIRKASLYSHFGSKKEILDAIVAGVSDFYEKHAAFPSMDWNGEEGLGIDPYSFTAEKMAAKTEEHIRYILHTPVVCKSRKMLVVEQFRNPELAAILTKRNYDDVLHFYTDMFRYLIRHGIVRDDDPEMLAAEYCFPISVWLEICDRDPDREEEVIGLVRKHVLHFMEMVQNRPTH